MSNTPDSVTIKTAIVEDERTIREGLAMLINGTPGFCCTGSYRSVEEALDRIKYDVPAIVLSDIGLPGIDGIQGIRLLKDRYPQLQLLMLTIYDDDDRIFDACNQLQKNIQFRVADFAGNSAGRISIDEKPQNITDSCSNATVSMSSCSGETSTYGNFTDGPRTGCPWNGQANCGFISQNVWRWCRGGPYTPPGPVDLASMTYEVRRSVVRVDGQSDITDGADKFP